MRSKVATIMCFYSGDRIEHLKESIDSIFCQTYTHSDLYLLINGQVSNEAMKLLAKYKNRGDFFIVFSKDNLGLAAGMNYLLDKHVMTKNYSYIARMDADDICLSNRYEKQVSFLDSCPDVAVVGSDCIEIDEIGNTLGYKAMESNDLLMKKNIIIRCPFNHPSVMIRLSVFKSGCRYDPELKNTQDYYFWVDLISKGYIFANINEGLLKFRITESFYKKRGKVKAANDLRGRFYAMKKLKIFTVKNLLFSLGLYILRLSPLFVSKLAYKFLR
jgi:glycosyltransferase involved in cell wall biosynthesis